MNSWLILWDFLSKLVHFYDLLALLRLLLQVGRNRFHGSSICWVQSTCGSILLPISLFGCSFWGHPFAIRKTGRLKLPYFWCFFLQREKMQPESTQPDARMSKTSPPAGAETREVDDGASASGSDKSSKNSWFLPLLALRVSDCSTMSSISVKNKAGSWNRSLKRQISEV